MVQFSFFNTSILTSARETFLFHFVGICSQSLLQKDSRAFFWKNWQKPAYPARNFFSGRSFFFIYFLPPVGSNRVTISSPSFRRVSSCLFASSILLFLSNSSICAVCEASRRLLKVSITFPWICGK